MRSTILSVSQELALHGLAFSFLLAPFIVGIDYLVIFVPIP
jgi:hypothetical protein